MNLPNSFLKTIIATYPDGAEWLDVLPTRIEEITNRWSLTIGAAVNNLSYNYVAPSILSDGTEAVLKLGPPNPELTTEIEALRLYDGHGMAQLLESDPDAGAMLLERLRPGQMLSTIEDDEIATSIAANIMRQLWRPLPPDHPFPTLELWFRDLSELRSKSNGGTGPIPPRIFDEADSLFAELITSQGEPVLLHGDVHHFNILTAQRSPWLAIDPKGIAGEREFDTAQFLLNPWPDLLRRPNPKAILARRIDQFSGELGFDRARIRGWGIANAVLSACWGVKDEEFDHRYDLQCAELLSEIKA
jgi:streptomycin 6-kinase